MAETPKASGAELGTKPEEFARFTSLLPVNPYLIPLVREGKKPDVPEGESWKGPKYKLTTDEAYKRLCAGLNVGIVATGAGLLIFDLDDPDKYIFPKKTLTVVSRNGKPHKFYLNDGTVRNAKGKGQYKNCGEVRAEWQYVVCAGSFVPSDSPRGTGLYHIIEEREPATLSASELPAEFLPTPVASLGDTVTLTEIKAPYANHNSLTLEEIRKLEPKLNKLLKNDSSEYPSASEADMATLSKLLYYEYSQAEAVALLLLFRDREKLRRADYIQATLAKIQVTSTYTQRREETEDEATPDMKATLDDIHRRFVFKTPTDIEEIYIYNEGIYEKAEHKIKEHLEKLYKHKVTSHYISEVLDHVRRFSYADRSDFNKASTVIPVTNGLLDLSTLTLEPFRPDRIFTCKLNAAYKPEAKCPHWEAFIKEVVDPEDLPALQEYLGYCLVPSMPYHKFMWFYGGGRNGKGRVIATLLALFGGKDHCSSLEIDDFNGDRRFRIALLFGKAINVSSEPFTHKTLQTPILKKLTGEDMIDAEIKNKQQPLRFMNTAKMFIMGNRFPKVNDDTVAFWDRVLFTNYPKTFLGEKAIPDIEHRWTKNPEEMSGILNWMIEGLVRLLQKGAFTTSKTTEQTKLAFKRASNTASAFITEQCELIPNAYETRANTLDFYKDYCEAYGIPADDERVFTAKLKQLPGVRSVKKRIEGTVERVWLGLRVKPLKTDEEPEEEQTNTTTNSRSEADEADGALIPPSEILQNVRKEEEEIERREGEAYASSAPHAPPLTKVAVCAICLKPLPPDHFDTTFYFIHEVHVVCFLCSKDAQEGSGHG